MEIENNIYLSASAGQGSFLVEGGKTLTLNGIVLGGGTLNKKGAGTLELGYYNSYMGGVYAEAGFLRANTESILGNITILSGAEVEFKQDFDGYYTGDIDSAGTIIKAGQGILIAREDDQQTGSLSIGTLKINEGVFIAQTALNGNAYAAQAAAASDVKKSKEIIEEIIEVVSKWKNYASEAGVDKRFAKQIESNLILKL
ncbi:MAG: hypothetical protein LBG46_07485 [Elusimicrobiota bacterium]|jgi:hypothetical protein|nr:hypothetical protein [Elusimicrobiota bacterium]